MNGTMTVDEAVDNLRNGNRGDVRLAVRMHPDPAHFVLEMLAHMNDVGVGATIAIADLRRLLSV